MTLDTQLHSDTKADSPFLLSNELAYQAWRQKKLDAFAKALCLDPVYIENPLNISEDEKQALRLCLSRMNLALYRVNAAYPVDKTVLQQMAEQFGATDQDNNLCADESGITSLTVQNEGPAVNYIPYTNKALSWHTDGYYNEPDRQIHSILMHCVTPADSGGENAYLDPEMLYLYIRDRHPEYISALMHAEAMTIPANTTGGEEIRAEVTGPVFSVQENGRLHMRYSARTRNIQWRDDPATKAVCTLITEYLASDSPYIIRYRLAANEGVISNNVLHNRSSFDEPAKSQRELYRIRFYRHFDF